MQIKACFLVHGERERERGREKERERERLAAGDLIHRRPYEGSN
jgi:hypothetical protein